jgi:hypothetical protein
MVANGSVQKKSVGFFGWLRRLLLLIILGAASVGGWWFYQNHREVEVLKEMVARLTAERRVADVWVEDYRRDEDGNPTQVRLKILEYRGKDKPLDPVFCTFSVNDVIHFEALVIRLNDELIKEGKGKSIYLFRRAFALDDKGKTYESCEINKPMEVPGGYSLKSDDPQVNEIEGKYWKSFWVYALDEQSRKKAGVKNAQIEAPATRFVPDKIYRMILENDGGLRIQASPVPEILKGEHLKIHDKKTTSEVGE